MHLLLPLAFHCPFLYCFFYSQLAEMVNLHFLNLIEALQECNSLVLSKVSWIEISLLYPPIQPIDLICFLCHEQLFPMWTPILFSYHSQVSIILWWIAAWHQAIWLKAKTASIDLTIHVCHLIHLPAFLSSLATCRSVCKCVRTGSLVTWWLTHLSWILTTFVFGCKGCSSSWAKLRSSPLLSPSSSSFRNVNSLNTCNLPL